MKKNSKRNFKRKTAGGDQTSPAAVEAKQEHYAMLLRRFPCNSADAQSMRLYHALQFAPVDTIEARKWLDIMMPAARIFELREQGKLIDTLRVIRPTDEGELHSVAQYVLQPGSLSDG